MRVTCPNCAYVHDVDGADARREQAKKAGSVSSPAKTKAARAAARTRWARVRAARQAAGQVDAS